MLGYLKAVFFEALAPCLFLYLSIKVALTLPVPSASSGVRLMVGLAQFLAEWRAGPLLSFSPSLALNYIRMGLLTCQIPFPDLMIPEDFSLLDCWEKLYFYIVKAQSCRWSLGSLPWLEPSGWLLIAGWGDEQSNKLHKHFYASCAVV